MQIVCQRNINEAGENQSNIVRMRENRPEPNRMGLARYFYGFRYLAYQAK
jgi:hypothetical protein